MSPTVSPTAPLRVMLADDHTVLREGLRRSLEVAGFDVVAEVGDGTLVLEAALVSDPDVVVMDVSLPGKDGIESTRELATHLPQVAVVVLSMFADETTVKSALDAGAVRYLAKDCTTSTIVTTLVEAVDLLDGRAHSHPPSDGPRCRPAESAAASHGLTQRELEILQMLANGASTIEVARRSYISAKTVKNHVAHIYAKLGAGSRTQAVAKAVRMGIVRIS